MKVFKPSSSQPIPNTANKVYQGKIFSVYQWEQRQFDGSIKTFEKIKRLDSVGIIPITKVGKIILTRQEQPGTKPFISFPGGFIEENEEALGAGKRELLEETGYVANSYLFWDAMQPVSKIEWAIYLFIAKECIPHQPMKLDVGERIDLLFVSFDQFIKIALSEDFRDTEVTIKVLKSLHEKSTDKMKELFYSKV